MSFGEALLDKLYEDHLQQGLCKIRVYPKYCSHSSLFIYTFFHSFQPHHMKLKLNWGLQIGGRLLIANYYDYDWPNQLCRGVAVRSYLLHASLVQHHVRLGYSLSPASASKIVFHPPNCAEMQGQNHVVSQINMF